MSASGAQQYSKSNDTHFDKELKRDSIRILSLEANPDDAQRLTRALKNSCLPFELRVVETRSEFESLLAKLEPDVLLSSSAPEATSGSQTLEIASAICPDSPFIFLLAEMEEEDASRALSLGATDYVSKSRLPLIVPVILRALRERDQRLEYRRMERELSNTRRLEAIGQLAGGVAHDFNNFLTVISGYAEILLAQEELSMTARAGCLHIQKAAASATDLTSQLLAFSRRGMLRNRPTDLNYVVRDMCDLLRDVLTADQTLETNLAPELWSVEVDPAQFQRVLMNFATNARDAMPRGGTVTIETSNVEDRQSDLREASSSKGEFVRMTFRDTGLGMDARTAERAFEPFYTTKEPGQGTGLGLPTAHGIVTQSNGKLTVESAPDQGTQFEILLPRVLDAPVVPLKRDSLTPCGGTETVLVVEDEGGVRDFVRETLTSHGYTVLAASSLAQVRLLLKHVRSDIDLLLTDVALPNGTGPEIAAMVRASIPTTRVLFMSGYTERSLARFALPGWKDSLLNKPFSSNELAQRVRSTLDEPDGFPARPTSRGPIPKTSQSS